MQSSGLHRKSGSGGPGQKLQPSGLGGLQTLPGLHPKVKSEPGFKGAELPVGTAGQTVTSTTGETVTVVPGWVIVDGGTTTVVVIVSPSSMTVVVTVEPGRVITSPGTVTVSPGAVIVSGGAVTVSVTESVV